MMNGIGMGAENFSTGGVLFVATSFVSSGSQKKEYSEVDFGCIDAVTFIGEVTLFFSSASRFQKKERSEMDFVHGDTGDEMSFVEEAI